MIVITAIAPAYTDWGLQTDDEQFIAQQGEFTHQAAEY